MRAKKIKIKFQSIDQTFADFKKDWRALAKGKAPKHLAAGETPVLLMDYALFSKVFSAERLRIMQVVKSKKPVSVSDLAVMLQREQANVHRDVHFLAELGILDLVRVKKDGKAEAVRPQFKWNGFDIELNSNAANDEAA